MWLGPRHGRVPHTSRRTCEPPSVSIAAIAVASGVAVASLACRAAASQTQASRRTQGPPRPQPRLPGRPARRQAPRPPHREGRRQTDVRRLRRHRRCGPVDGRCRRRQAAAAIAPRTGSKHATTTRTTRGTPPNYYPGSSAKLLLVAEAQHIDPENFGGVTWSARSWRRGRRRWRAGPVPEPRRHGLQLERDQPVARRTGARQHCRLGWQPSANAVDFLAGQLCDDGGFQNAIRSGRRPLRRRRKKTSTPPATRSRRSSPPATTQDAKTALGWLGQSRRTSGGWTETTGKADANSTALAVEALIAGHRDDAEAMKWLAAPSSDAPARCPARCGEASMASYDVATRPARPPGRRCAGRHVAGRGRQERRASSDAGLGLPQAPQEEVASLDEPASRRAGAGGRPRRPPARPARRRRGPRRRHRSASRSSSTADTLGSNVSTVVRDGEPRRDRRRRPEAAGHTDQFRNDGLICTIDGLPKTGCGDVDDIALLGLLPPRARRRRHGPTAPRAPRRTSRPTPRPRAGSTRRQIADAEERAVLPDLQDQRATPTPTPTHHPTRSRHHPTPQADTITAAAPRACATATPTAAHRRRHHAPPKRDRHRRRRGAAPSAAHLSVDAAPSPSADTCGAASTARPSASRRRVTACRADRRDHRRSSALAVLRRGRDSGDRS